MDSVRLVDVEQVQVFTALLALCAAAAAIVAVMSWALSSRWPAAATGRRALAETGIWLAWLIAAGATIGSLYFSEVAHFAPCRLCWFQRIAMYPLAAILLVGAVRRDRLVAWYSLPLALVGVVISTYHTILEWRPSLDSGVCSIDGPSCTTVWFREFGFLSLPTMAGIGFVAIAVLVALVAQTPSGTAADDATTTVENHRSEDR